jgi:hypothetical protein
MRSITITGPEYREAVQTRAEKRSVQEKLAEFRADHLYPAYF